MIINIIIYKHYKSKNKLKNHNDISSTVKTKAELNKGKCKESEITLNDDDDDNDIIINRKSIDQSKQEIDIIDIRTNDTIKDSTSNDIKKEEKIQILNSDIIKNNNNNNNNNIDNPDLKEVTKQNSFNNNNSGNFVNDNSNNNNNNNNISNEALLQHVNYLHNYINQIVNNMSNNGIIQPSYLPNNNDTITNGNILPSYSEHIQQSGINYPFIQPSAPFIPLYNNNVINQQNNTNMNKEKN